MLSSIKKTIPQPINKQLKPIKNKSIDDSKKRKLFLHMQEKHKDLLQQIKGKEKIKVVFLAIHKSVWKVDPVFQKMLADPFFEPVILVCPYTLYGEERMWQDMQECYEYFEQKGYPLLSSYNKEEQRWVTLEEIKPDIVFFTNPHNLTRKEYYEDAYLNYLSCYVPYYSDVASDYDLNNAYNQVFHNVLWRHFIGDEYVKKRALSVLSNNGSNIIVTGSPMLEELVSEKSLDLNKIWRNQPFKKKRVIYAPHQSIFKNEIPNLSTFLEVGELIKELAKKYKDQIQWSFKPHTLLKPKLYQHPDWGKIKTDEYYDFWKRNNFTQIDEGGYVELFQTSDAILHDCGSFILDYLFTGRPCAYLELNSKVQLKSINSYGQELLDCYFRITKNSEIEEFLVDVISDNCKQNDSYKGFFHNNVKSLYKDTLPSESIVENIKQAVK